MFLISDTTVKSRSIRPGARKRGSHNGEDSQQCHQNNVNKKLLALFQQTSEIYQHGRYINQSYTRVLEGN